MVQVGRIRPDPAQPRKNLDTQAQRNLVVSIQQVGILQPITVRYIQTDDIYQVIAGERRFQAAREIGLPEIPCWVKEPKAEDVLLHQIVENWQREDLHPFDLADALVFLRDSNGYSQKQLADLTGKAESEISRILSLLKLNPAAQRFAREDESGLLSRRHLLAVATMPEVKQVETVTRIQAGELTAVETEMLVRNERKKAMPARGAPAGTKVRFKTGNAVVLVTIRKRDVVPEDVIAALMEALDQAKAKAQVKSTDIS